MRQTQKKENKFPVFDLVLILVIALAIAGGVFWVTSRRGVRQTEVVYTVRFSNVDNAYAGRFAEEKTLYLWPSGSPAGVISSATVTRSTERTLDRTPLGEPGETRTYTETKSETNSDILVTVRLTAEASAGGYFIGKERIAAGMEIGFMTGGFAADGEILTLDVG
ncbi:MAG: DUF4330 domain-containing protein [Clostridia bacterium]|nr:DUF4330 domain-containing protein [Clostridia bacterium]